MFKAKHLTSEAETIFLHKDKTWTHVHSQSSQCVHLEDVDIEKGKHFLRWESLTLTGNRFSLVFSEMRTHIIHSITRANTS